MPDFLDEILSGRHNPFIHEISIHFKLVPCGGIIHEIGLSLLFISLDVLDQESICVEQG